MKPSLPFNRVMGLNVVDEALYQQYRQQMVPILTEYGGAFAYDFRVAEVLFAQSDAPVNRVFCIRFPSHARMNAFFSDRRYVDIREQYFIQAVSAVTPIAIGQDLSVEA